MMVKRLKQWFCGAFGGHVLIQPTYIVGDEPVCIREPEKFIPINQTSQWKNKPEGPCYLGPSAHCDKCGLVFGLVERPYEAKLLGGYVCFPTEKKGV